jgi:hypothetical protein
MRCRGRCDVPTIAATADTPLARTAYQSPSILQVAPAAAELRSSSSSPKAVALADDDELVASPAETGRTEVGPVQVQGGT